MKSKKYVKKSARYSIINFVWEKLYERKLIVITLSVVILFFIFFNKSANIPKNRNLIWSNHLHESEIIDKFYMKYDDNALGELDYLINSENLDAEKRKVLRKSINKINEVSAFRSKFEIKDSHNHSHTNSFILEKAKKKFRMFNIKENYMHVNILNFTNLEDFLVNIKVESGMCNFETNMIGFDHHVEEEILNILADCIFKDIKSMTGKTVMIGPNEPYMNVLPLIFKKHNPNTKLGSIVFDAQINSFDYEIDNIHNVIGKNLDENKIDMLIFLGISTSRNNNISLYLSHNSTKEAHILDKIELYYDKDYSDKEFWQKLSKSIERLKEENISNIIFTVNLDVLPEEYTGFEYSILAPAMSLAKYYKYYYDLPVQSLGSVDFDDPFFRGLTTEEIIDIISFIKQEAAKHGIKIGFDINNATFVGDIEELLPEQDLNLETTEAAVRIAKIMTQ